MCKLNKMQRRQARESSGLTIDDAALVLGIKPATLRRIENRGGASLHLALRMASLYDCRPEIFA